STRHLFVLHLYPHTTPSPSLTHTLSLHDALPISLASLAPALPEIYLITMICVVLMVDVFAGQTRRGLTATFTLIVRPRRVWPAKDRKSTRLNSSHVAISYAVFCLKKKKKQNHHCK